MSVDIPSSTRKSVLKRGLLLVAGAVGLGAVEGKATAATPKAPPGSTSLKLYGRRWHLQVQGRPPAGKPPTDGDRVAVFGELLDQPNGKPIGEFHSAAFSMPLPAGASVELHTFTLKDGTILGMGSVTSAGKAYAIVGGTGRYAGARGSYTARQRPEELGGDGTAEFVLTLTA